MPAVCGNSTVIHDNYIIRIGYGGKPVSDNNDCLALHELSNGALYHSFVFGIDVSCCFVENNYGRI